MRVVITRVLPVPAPARTSSGPSTVETASRCDGLSVASRAASPRGGRSWIVGEGCREGAKRGRTYTTGLAARGRVVASSTAEDTMANPFVHVELNTTDLDKAKTFYGRLFDWKLEDMKMGPAGTYTMISPGKGTGGGMLKHPVPGAPSS